MKNFRKFLSLLLAAAMVLAALPAMAEDGVTRAFAIHSFVEVLGKENFAVRQGDISGFSDAAEVPEEYREDMEIAVANGIILGSGGKLLPNQELSRLEAMIILGRFLDGPEEVRPGIEFTDVPDWAEEDIDRLYRAGIVNGYGGGRLGSDDPVSREQLALLTGRVRAAYPWTADLKDDYYSSVNGEFLKSNSVNDRHPENSYSSRLRGSISAYLVKRSDELLARLNGGEKLNQAEELAAQIYGLALDGPEDERLTEPVDKYLALIDGCEDATDFGRVNGIVLRDLSTPIMFEAVLPCRVSADGYLEAVDGVYLEYVDTGVDKTYWQDDPEGVRDAYETYAAKIFDLAGIEVSAAAVSAAADFQRDVALAGLSASEYYSMKEPEWQYVFDWEELGGMYAGKWKNPLPYIFFSLDPKEMTGLDAYVVPDRGETDKAVELMNTVDAETVRTVCKLNLISRLSDFLPPEFRDAESEFTMAAMGVGSQSSLKAHAAGLASTMFPAAYEEDFVGTLDYDKKFLQDMTDDIVNVFEQKFASSGRISPETAERARAKLDRVEKAVCDYDRADSVSYRVTFDTEKSFFANGVESLESVGGDYFSVVVLVDDTFPSYTVNASYGTYANRIDIYGGILGAPYYDPSASYEENLGSIGFVIAHELSHAFDGNGSLYNENGDLEPWWEEDDYERYDEFVDKLGAYYGGYANAFGEKVDSGLTSNENIADILAMECVIALAKEKGLDLDKVFRSFAKSWAAIYTPKYARYLSRVDNHSPNNARVNAVLSNFDEFYETYGITEGDGMYVPPEERVRFF